MARHATAMNYLCTFSNGIETSWAVLEPSESGGCLYQNCRILEIPKFASCEIKRAET